MATDVVHGMSAYSIHGHTQAGTEEEPVLDYGSFFNRLYAEDPHDLRRQVGSDTVAIAYTGSRSGRLAFRFVAGNARALPLVYDLSTATAEEVNPGKGRFVVSGAWAIIDSEQRIAVVDRKRPGVAIYQIERFLSQYGRDRLGLTGLSISLNPIPTESFREEIEDLYRIRVAEITLRRPNHSWTHTAEGVLQEIGESNAAEVTIQLNADRGESLAKDRGIVADVLSLALNPINALKDVVIKGRSENFDGEKVVSLKRHIVRGTVHIDEDEGPLAHLEALDQLAGDLIAQAVTEAPQVEGQSDRGPVADEANGV
jgi:hypothetical protein